MKIKSMPIAFGIRQGELFLMDESKRKGGAFFSSSMSESKLFTSYSKVQEESEKLKGVKIVKFYSLAEDVDPEGPQATYRAVQSWIEDNKHSGAATALAKLVVSLWNPEISPTPLRNCLNQFDEVRHGWAQDIVIDFMKRGENSELSRLARFVLDENYLEEAPCE